MSDTATGTTFQCSLFSIDDHRPTVGILTPDRCDARDLVEWEWTNRTGPTVAGMKIGDTGTFTIYSKLHGILKK